MIVALAVAVAIAIAIAISITGTNSVAIADAVAHRPRCWPLPLWSPLTIAAAISVALPSAIAVAIALAVGHCLFVTFGHYSCHLYQPSPLPSPSTISESCCLGAARIVFNQLKQPYFILFGQWAAH